MQSLMTTGDRVEHSSCTAEPVKERLSRMTPVDKISNVENRVQNTNHADCSWIPVGGEHNLREPTKKSYGRFSSRL